MKRRGGKRCNHNDPKVMPTAEYTFMDLYNCNEKAKVAANSIDYIKK